MDVAEGELRKLSRVIAADLSRAEASINIAMKDAAQLVVTVVDGTSAAGVAAAITHPALASVIRGLNELASGQQHVAKHAHDRLHAVALGLGLDYPDWGGSGPKPSSIDLAQDAPAVSADPTPEPSIA